MVGDQINGVAALGRVLSVSGSQAQVRLAVGAWKLRATVGKFLGIHDGPALVVGVITKIAVDPARGDAREGEFATAQVDLLGEIKQRRARRASSSAASPTIR